jgi:hypothetical protein
MITTVGGTFSSGRCTVMGSLNFGSGTSGCRCCRDYFESRYQLPSSQDTFFGTDTSSFFVIDGKVTLCQAQRVFLGAFRQVIASA